VMQNWQNMRIGIWLVISPVIYLTMQNANGQHWDKCTDVCLLAKQHLQNVKQKALDTERLKSFSAGIWLPKVFFIFSVYIGGDLPIMQIYGIERFKSVSINHGQGKSIRKDDCASFERHKP